MRLLAGGLLFLLAMPPLLRAQDSVIVIDPDLRAGRLVGRAGRPAGRRRVRAAGLLQRQRDHPGAGGRELPGREHVRRPAGDLPRVAPARGTGPGRRRRGQRHAVPAAGRRRGGRRAGGRRPAHPEPGSPPRGPRAGAVGRGTGAARPRRRARAARAPPPARRAGHGARQLPDRPRPHRPAARHRRHLQPDRGAADRLRPDLRAPALPAVARAAGPARHPPHRGRGVPAEQRLRLRRPGRAGLPRGRHRRTDLQRGRAVRRAAALGRRERLVGLPAPAGFPRLVRAARRRRRGLGAAHQVAALRALGPAGPREQRAGHRSVVAAPERRSLAPQSAQRRRPLLHHRRPARPRHPQRPRARLHRLAPQRAVRAQHQRRRGAGDAARERAPADPDRRRLRLRPAHARFQALLAADSQPAGERPPPRRRLDRRRSPAGPAPGLARRPRPDAGLRIPRLHLRARGASSIRRTPRSATARSWPSSRSAPGWASTSATACAIARAAPAGGSSASRRRISSSWATPARPGSRATGPARSR